MDEKAIGKELFIPQNVKDLYKRLGKEELQGQLSREGEWLVWKLSNGIVLEIGINPQLHEGYIAPYYLKNGKRQELGHWHPLDDEIYQDLIDINNGDAIWIKEETFFGEQIFMIDRNKYEVLNDRRKDKCTIL